MMTFLKILCAFVLVFVPLYIAFKEKEKYDSWNDDDFMGFV